MNGVKIHPSQAKKRLKRVGSRTSHENDALTDPDSVGLTAGVLGNESREQSVCLMIPRVLCNTMQSGANKLSLWADRTTTSRGNRLAGNICPTLQGIM